MDAQTVRAYAHKHEIGLLEAKKRCRRKALDQILSVTRNNAKPDQIIKALKIMVDDLYPEDLDTRYPNGATDRYPRDHPRAT